mmetsp:Transcript_1059/g.2924  ORF Transcript_1059/g.2924 Transcript_1059/m.2924 type:complete len:211 (+) Transcript_1059:101-733(+)|eukprot:CAMPEP_0168733626 /NCGR_PEP_ID=MMETSP0724-20121128/8390_1 /TAXON_ID=265536 /ORGANISM="Amphiprora sp., Strain CCMP467" /LENGTH=210 /DNA_ID=CAMNT_0008780695 /DNA_START=51 /DNA_END=683 /DNA_ORIENTATION=+
MIRSILLLAVSSLPLAFAWTTGSAVSSFGGNVLITGREASVTMPGSSSLVMKKGKSNVPPNMRGQYARQKEMAAMRDQMIAASKPGDDGFPVFNLFVRTKRANVWYPCGSFKGDERSAALAKSYADGGMLSGISKKQLDGGIAGSLWQDQDRLKESIVRSFPQLKKSKNEFEFGYKLGYEGLSPEKADEMVIVVPKENKGPLDGLRNVFS